MSRIGIGHDLAGGAFVASDPLLNGLVAYWKMDEASGTRSDSIGNYTLTDNNTVGSATGLIGNCASMVYTAGEYLSLSGAQVELLIPEGSSYTVTGWVRFPNGWGSGVYLMGPVHCDVNSGSYFYRFKVAQYGPPPTGGWGWYVSVENTGGGPFQEAITATDWNFIAITYDASLQQATFQCNGNSDHSWSSTPRVKGADIPCPITMPHTVYNYTDTQVDECAIWTRALTRAERDRIYNAGSGLSLV